MIRVEHLKKDFTVSEKTGFTKKKKTVEAVKDVTMELEAGKIIGLLGINGAGKTTTIKMMSTLLEPTSGSYFIDGVDAVKRPFEAKRAINMVAGGERMIYWRLTARENLWYFGQIYGVGNSVLKERIERLIKLVGLEGKADTPVETFSKGMKQRLQIARGLINDPKYLFMDEPTIGLDVMIAKELRAHILNLAKNENKAILLTSHYLGEVEELCDYIYVLNHGSVIRQGTAAELTREVIRQKKYVLKTYDPTERVLPVIRDGLAELIRVKAEAEAKEDYLEITCDDNISVELSRICVNNGLLIREMYELAPKFEDVIIQFAKECQS